MKQLAFDFIDGREPSLRDLMRQAGIETSTDIAKRYYLAGKNKKNVRPRVHRPPASMFPR